MMTAQVITMPVFLVAACGDPGAAPAECPASIECSDSLVCDVPSGECVECTQDEPGACTGDKPVCGNNHECRGCIVHAECESSSNVCGPDGDCVAEGDVAYVKPAAMGGTDNSDCTKLMPCTKVAKALDTGRRFVKFSGMTDEEVTVDNRQVVTFLADPAAKLTRSSGGAILTVKDDGTSLTVYDLTISDGPNPGGIGIVVPAGSGTAAVSLHRVTVSNNPGGGISVSGGTLTIAQSTISNNQGGGISVIGAATIFNITNSFIVRNGNSMATVGGASLEGATTGSVFAFNTLADNEIRVGASAGGVFCNISGFLAPNNLIVRNLVNNMPGMANSNTGGVCTFPTSTIATTISGLDFVQADEPPFNYHIQQASSAIDQATTASTVNVDVDRETRPQGSAPDQGADEVR